MVLLKISSFELEFNSVHGIDVFCLDKYQFNFEEDNPFDHIE